MSFLQSLLPVLLSIGMALTFDRFSESKGLLAPNFRFDPQASAGERQRALVRRTGSLVLLALLFWLGVFAPLGMIGEVDPAAPIDISTPDLFSLHFIFVLGLVIWYLLGFAGSKAPLAEGWAQQFGLRATNIPREIGIGVVAGVVGWIGVLTALLVIVMIVYLLGGEEVVPTVPPKIIPILVGLPVGVRLALSLSAGVVEETFFRGFLQPRLGIATSTILFVLAHMSYEQPFMLLGVGLLSVLFAMLVRWRQNIWAAMTAHAVFDAIQLLFVIPQAMEMFEQVEPEGLTALLTGVALF